MSQVKILYHEFDVKLRIHFSTRYCDKYSYTSEVMVTGKTIKESVISLKEDVSVVFCQFHPLTHMESRVLGCESSVDVIIPQP